MTTWTADPKRGEAELEPRRAEIVQALENAADVAYFVLEDQLKADIEELKRKVGEKKSQINKTVEQARVEPAMKIIRKYWSSDKSTMWQHFVHNMTENSGKA